MTETVSKTKVAVTPEITPTAEAILVDGEARKTLTKWRVFEEGGFIPVVWRCEGYLGSHPSDLSCHTNLRLLSENILRHMDPAHGGGWFRVKFRVNRDRVSPIWRELENAGVEMQEFYCPHCRELVPMTPRAIVKHLQPHAGATRINQNPQCLNMTLSFQKADLEEYDELYEDRLATV